MALLFKPEMAEAILDRRKTCTRRRWKRARVKVGSIHKCYIHMPFRKFRIEPIASRVLPIMGPFEDEDGKKFWMAGPFARVRIVSVDFEWGVMGGLTREQQEAEARLEGFANRLDFYGAWYAINGADSAHDGTYRVEFTLEAEGSGDGEA